MQINGFILTYLRDSRSGHLAIPYIRKLYNFTCKSFPKYRLTAVIVTDG